MQTPETSSQRIRSPWPGVSPGARSVAIGLVLAVCTMSGCGDSNDPEERAASGARERGLGHRGSPSAPGRLIEQRYVDDVRLGRQVDPEGEVPPDSQSDVFAAGEPVYVSMEVIDAPAGSRVRLSVHEAATNRKLWSDEQDVTGRSHLSFTIGGGLAHGRYEAKVFIDDRTVADRRFEIVSRAA